MLKIFKTDKITLGILLSFFLIESHAESDSAESYLQKDSIKQGVIVESNSSEVEVFINDKSYGKGEELKIELPPGEYKIIGKRENCFDDVERGKVKENEIITVDLYVKEIRMQVSPRFSLCYFFKTGSFDPLIGINLGWKYKKYYWGINLAAIDRLSDDFLIFSVFYNFTFFKNEFFISEAGIYQGVFNSSKKQKGAFLIAPNLDFNFGFEHLKFYAGIMPYIFKYYGFIISIETGFTIFFPIRTNVVI